MSNSPQSRSSAVEQIDERIARHPAYRSYVQHSALEATIKHVVEPNWRELLQLLIDASADVDLALQLIQNVGRSTVAENFRVSLDQRLHNYVASVFTLIEHVQTLRKGGVLPTEVVETSTARLPGLNGHPEIEFVKLLRNYTQHYRLPITAHTLSFKDMQTPNPSMSSEVQLVVTELLRWSGWNEATKKWMAAQGDVLNLRPIIEQHGTLLLKFNTELLNDFARSNAFGLAQLNELIVERQAALSGSDTETARSVVEAVTRRRAGEHIAIPGFEAFFNPPDLDDTESFPQRDS